MDVSEYIPPPPPLQQANTGIPSSKAKSLPSPSCPALHAPQSQGMWGGIGARAQGVHRQPHRIISLWKLKHPIVPARGIRTDVTSRHPQCSNRWWITVLMHPSQLGSSGLGINKADPYVAEPTVKNFARKRRLRLLCYEEKFMQHASCLVRQGVWTHWNNVKPFDLSWINSRAKERGRIRAKERREKGRRRGRRKGRERIKGRG